MNPCPECQYYLRQFRENYYCYNCGEIYSSEDNRSRHIPDQTRSIVQNLLGKIDVRKMKI